MDKLNFEKAMTHMMIAKGSVALSPKANHQSWQDKQRGFNTGSYYGSYIEADIEATKAFYERLANGARPIYEECGPSDFGQENRFNGTFTDTQLVIHYSLMPIVLDDDPTPVNLIAGVDMENSFVTTLKMLIAQDLNSIEDAIEAMGKRTTAVKDYKNHVMYMLHHSLECPSL